jgi:hypothetical protein
LANRRSATLASRASWRSPGPFVMRLGCRASGRTCRLASMDRQISSSSCSTTQLTFRWSEAMGASFTTSSRWPRRENLTGGSRGCPRSPFHLGEASASASSTNSLPWGWSPRIWRDSWLSAVLSLERKRLRLRAWGLRCLVFR